MYQASCFCSPCNKTLEQLATARRTNVLSANIIRYMEYLWGRPSFLLNWTKLSHTVGRISYRSKWYMGWRGCWHKKKKLRLLFKNKTFKLLSLWCLISVKAVKLRSMQMQQTNWQIIFLCKLIQLNSTLEYKKNKTYPQLASCSEHWVC